MNNVDVEDIINNIRVTIKKNNLNSIQLGYVTPYFKGFLKSLESKDKIVIMGMGDNGKRLYNICDEIRYNVIALCDNNPDLQKIKYRNNSIISPEQAVRNYPDAVYVITSQVAVIQMAAQLMNLGINSNSIEFFNISRTGLV